MCCLVSRLVEEKERADLWIVNSCTVKGPSQSGMTNLVETGRRLGKKLVVSGCVPQGDRRNAAIKDLSAIGSPAPTEMTAVMWRRSCP